MDPVTAVCDLAPAQWLFFSPDVPVVIYWADFSAFFLSLGLAIFVFKSNPRGLANRILFVTLIIFAVTAFLGAISDATNKVDLVLFIWAFAILMEPIIYGGSLYLLYVLIDKKDMPLKSKLLFGLLYLPIIIAAPTTLMLGRQFDITLCLTTEGPIATFYIYALEIFTVLWIIVFAARRYLSATETLVKQEIAYLTTGIVLFLVAFSWGNIAGSVTDNWVLGRWGLFGVPIFTSFLVYTIVKFKTFNIKILASVALILGLTALLFVGLFV